MLVGTVNSMKPKKLSKKSTWMLTCLLKSTKTTDPVEATAAVVAAEVVVAAMVVAAVAAAVMAVAAEAVVATVVAAAVAVATVVATEAAATDVVDIRLTTL